MNFLLKSIITFSELRIFLVISNSKSNGSDLSIDLNGRQNNQQNDKLFGLMDIIRDNNENNVHQKLNIPDYSMNSSSKNDPETLDEEEDESKQSLNPEHHDILDMNDSGIVQIPLDKNQSISSDINNLNRNEYETPLTSKTNTLNESIPSTILRDLKSIYYNDQVQRYFSKYYKLKYVINPFSSNTDKKRHINEWDLWGPLIFITFLSCTLAIKAQEKSKIIVIIFVIFWLGSFLIFLNGNLLDSNIKFFQVICLLGYCLFPLNISAFILAVSNFYDSTIFSKGINLDFLLLYLLVFGLYIR